MSKIIRKNIVCYGRVQGVGFRYRAKYAASLVHVTGWIENRFDYEESVEMEVQGTEEAIDKMLLLIEQGSFISIERMEVRKIEVRQDESGFFIKD